MITIDQALDQYKIETPDIKDHLDNLAQLAGRCLHVTEMGFRRGASFCALLKGLRDKPGSKLITYDININPKYVDLFGPLRGETELEFMQMSTLDAIIEDTDLLWIDTFHTYRQLKKELELHGHKAKKYLAFHDTVSYAHKGEDGSPFGLRDAIMEYIAGNPEWSIESDYQFNNGVMVLNRG